MSDAKIRLYLGQGIAQGQTVRLDEAQAHYLFGVMRLGPGAAIRVFDGTGAEHLARVVEAGRRGGSVAVEAPTRPFQPPPDLWLLFAPIKKARTDFIVEKATELGAARICPVQTDFTNAERIRRDRLQAHAVEAAEQCGGTFVPEVAELDRLAAVLDRWPADRRLMVCDEGRVGEAPALPHEPGGPWAILIGPEGGFSPAERARLGALPQAVTVGLGPRILRADTAAVAALTLWQSRLGDWT